MQAAWAQHAFMRGFEPSERCRNALEYQPTTIDRRLSLVYMVEAFWQIIVLPKVIKKTHSHTSHYH